MEAEVVTVGTELLLGYTLDSNAAALGRALSDAGVRIVRRTTVGDDREAIASAVRAALQRTGFVITTGGLGPTRDDVTRDAVAGVFELPLELDAVYLRGLEERFAAFRPGPMPAANRAQAMVPRGATTLRNPRGTAPGLWIEGAPGAAVLLPGVPSEMIGMLREEVIPRLVAILGAQAASAPVTRSRTLRTTGISESALADLMTGIDDEIAPATLAYLPDLEGVDLRLTVWSVAPAKATAILERGVAVVRNTVGSHAYGEGDVDLAAVVLDALRARGLRLAVAESCTGGLVGERLTAVPGASDVFLGGILAYADAVKVRELGVTEAMLTLDGAVSRSVAMAMLDGVMARFGAAAGVAVTGIAGPAGGMPDKPVGTVWLAARAGERTEAVCRRFPGDREAVRRRAAQAALGLLLRVGGGSTA